MRQAVWSCHCPRQEIDNSRHPSESSTAPESGRCPSSQQPTGMDVRSESGRQCVYNVRINDWLIDCMMLCIPFKNVSLREEWSHNWWKAAKLRPLLGACLEQGGLFTVPHLLWHGAIVNTISSKGPPHLVASYQRYRGPILILILTGSSIRHVFSVKHMMYAWEKIFLTQTQYFRSTWVTEILPFM